MSDKLHLEILDNKEQELKYKLDETQREIYRLLLKRPQVIINSWDDAGLFEHGRYAILAPKSKVDAIKSVMSGHDGNMITLINDEVVKMEDYFTEEEFASLRLI